ncbi:MAG TPA: alpha/beta fold hydrolase [Chitinophaga sp.]|uniref:thioesterase II family protein n=1 Tax=Chitinophaga sp. TaxID=1869181 RepID=UPI002F950A8C
MNERMKQAQLFLLHFAGGNRYSFSSMLQFLRDFEVVSLELPGRGKRMGEPLLKNFELAAADMYRQITAQLTSPRFVLYGHSMGAYLALRVAYMLEKAGKFPACIIVSGNAGPALENRKKRNLYLLDHENFVAELQKLGGVPPELIENEELFNFFEPILRADFEIAERNEITNETVVKAPLCAVMGTQEEDVDDIANWSRFTKAGFSTEILDGNHFFIHRHPQAMANIIGTWYGRANAPRHESLTENPYRSIPVNPAGKNTNI